jgi:hypothetical protein
VRRALGVLLAFVLCLVLSGLCMPIIGGDTAIWAPAQWFALFGTWLMSLVCLGFFVATFATPARPHLWGALVALVPVATMAVAGADGFLGGPADVRAAVALLAMLAVSAIAGGFGGHLGVALNARRDEDREDEAHDRGETG